jgi:hypothetical protein
MRILYAILLEEVFKSAIDWYIGKYDVHRVPR